MKRQSVIYGAILLAIGGVLAKVVGALYKIPLTNILGTNGMGLYYLVFPLYSLILVLVSSGISLAVSKLVSAERILNNKKNEVTIFKAALIYVTVLSVLLGIALMLLSENIAILQGNVNAKLSYFAIAPAILFASIIAVIRGYFQGQQNMVPTLVNNVLEQIVKLFAGLTLASLSINYGVAYAVMGAILGVTLSEFFALIFIVINYVVYKKQSIYKIAEPKSLNLTFWQALRKLVVYAYPATLSAIIFPITTLLDSFLVINILTSSGFSSLQATNLYGISNGIVNTLISLPVMLCASLATAIVPNLSGLHAKNNVAEVTKKTSFFIKITFIIASLGFIITLIYSPDIIELLYSRGLSDVVIDEFSFAYKLLMISSVSIIYFAFLQTFTAVLQSIDKPIIPFVSLLIAVVIRTILIFVLVSIPLVNIFGVAISNLAFLTIACLINVVFIKKYVALSFNFVKLIVVPIFASIVAGSVMFVIRMLLINLNIIIYMGVSALVGVAMYAIILFVFRAFNKTELTFFKRKNILGNKK